MACPDSSAVAGASTMHQKRPSPSLRATCCSLRTGRSVWRWLVYWTLWTSSGHFLEACHHRRASFRLASCAAFSTTMWP